MLIRDVFNEYRQVLGAEKIRTVLVQRGYKVSTRFVADVMREMGLVCVRQHCKAGISKATGTGEEKKCSSTTVQC